MTAIVCGGKRPIKGATPKRIQRIWQDSWIDVLQMLCQPLFGSGKVVVMDSGFCVAKGIVEVEARGVYGAALIKKQRYWPKSVPGNNIDKHFEDEEVGHCSILLTKTDEGKPFKIFCMKEPDYVMKVMASWMTLNELEGARRKRDWKEDGVNKSKTFNYRQPFGLNLECPGMIAHVINSRSKFIIVSPVSTINNIFKLLQCQIVDLCVTIIEVRESYFLYNS